MSTVEFLSPADAAQLQFDLGAWCTEYTGDLLETDVKIWMEGLSHVDPAAIPPLGGWVHDVFENGDPFPASVAAVIEDVFSNSPVDVEMNVVNDPDILEIYDVPVRPDTPPPQMSLEDLLNFDIKPTLFRCHICLCEHSYREVTAMLGCAHVIGTECWKSWRKVPGTKNQCVLCKAPNCESAKALEKLLEDTRPETVSSRGRKRKIPVRMDAGDAV